MCFLLPRISFSPLSSDSLFTLVLGSKFLVSLSLDWISGWLLGVPVTFRPQRAHFCPICFNVWDICCFPKLWPMSCIIHFFSFLGGNVTVCFKMGLERRICEINPTDLGNDPSCLPGKQDLQDSHSVEKTVPFSLLHKTALGRQIRWWSCWTTLFA